MKTDLFIHFKSPVSSLKLPQKFTFPFYYEPHPLSLIAAKELQAYIETQTEWNHNFGLKDSGLGPVSGKMFGVLVVQDSDGKLGYLAGFSGKLANQNKLSQFVPPVYDMLTEEGFFLSGMREIDSMSAKIAELECKSEYLDASDSLKRTQQEADKTIEAHREFMRESKRKRKEKRLASIDLISAEEMDALLNELSKESLHLKYQLREITKDWTNKISSAQEKLKVYDEQLKQLKKTRKEMSKKLQKKLFDEYHFLNNDGQKKSLWDIFKNTTPGIPPSGAGECAAPKLLHYAYLNDLKPVSIAEFWWGASPSSEIRKHGNFYPSCRGKCEPILGHMLQGLAVDENPMLIDPSEGKELKIIHEDEDIVVVNKPAEFLSVPGKTIKDCVYQRMLERYPNATGPLIVHRLDMATSGILLIAKTKEANKALQAQFIEKTIRKRYVALLDGELEQEEGIVDLPLRVDLDDRPRQLVCFEHGKEARTKWKVKERRGNKTLVYFYPITGRTHQLRVHAAHKNGLNIAIEGDDLYGKKSNRLHLHAEWIQFTHPSKGKMMTFQVDPEF